MHIRLSVVLFTDPFLYSFFFCSLLTDGIAIEVRDAGDFCFMHSPGNVLWYDTSVVKLECCIAVYDIKKYMCLLGDDNLWEAVQTKKNQKRRKVMFTQFLTFSLFFIFYFVSVRASF